jgi:hypothetical protein
VRHQDRASTALDDVVQRRQRALDSVDILDDASLDAVVIDADEDDFAGEISRVLQSTDAGHGARTRRRAREWRFGSFSWNIPSVGARDVSARRDARVGAKKAPENARACLPSVPPRARAR